MMYSRCCICGCLIEEKWNADPVKDGSCCQPCFVNIVLKARRSKHFLKGGIKPVKVYKVVWEENGEPEYTHVFTKTKAEAVEAFKEICKTQQVYPDDGSVMFYLI